MNHFRVIFLTIACCLLLAACPSDELDDNATDIETQDPQDPQGSQDNEKSDVHNTTSHNPAYLRMK